MPCRCSPLVVSSCLCSSDSTATITESGDGSPGFPFTYDARLSATVGNKLSEAADGLLVETLPWLRSYNSVNQNRAKGEALQFDSNDADTTSDPGIHSTSAVGTAQFFFDITRTGLWLLFAQTVVEDTNHITGLSLQWQDDGGNLLSGDGGDGAASSPAARQVYALRTLTQGLHVQVTLTWDTGAGPAAILGGGSYGHNTWATLICLHAF